MNYYRFFPDVFKIDGRKRSSIYELTSGKVIQIDEGDSYIYRCLADKSVEETVETYKESATRVVDEAVVNSWGTVYDAPVYAERYLPRMPFEIKGFTEAPLCISELQIELFIKDFYEPGRDGKVFQGCNSVISCARKPDGGEYRINRIIENVDELSEVPIRKLSLHVGALREHIGEIKKVIDCFLNYHRDERIEIVTYAEEITDEVTATFSKYQRMELVLNYKHIDNPEDVIDLLEKTGEAGITCTINWIIDKDERANYLSKSETLKDAGLPVRTTEYLNDSEKAVSISRKSDRLEKTDSYLFFERNRFSLCQYGKVSIDAAGEISSCLWQKKLGNIDQGIFKFFETNMHYVLWNTPKRQFSKCKDCENRYSCSDCAVIEQGDDCGMDLLCDYNPYEGKWEEEET